MSKLNYPGPARVRWFTFGAVVAAVCGVGAVVRIASADPPATRSVYVPITPCRLLDTRPPPDNVGARTRPLGSNETFTTAVRGANGNCTIPADAVGVGMNATVDNPTDASYLTVFPADAQMPLASSLNWVAGQPPTPNAVTTVLSANGEVSFYNHSGTVNLIVDIVGYYTAERVPESTSPTTSTTTAPTTTTTTTTTTPAEPEIVVSPGVGIASVLTSQLGTTSAHETVVTTTSGRWTISKTVATLAVCAPAAGRLFYITVDGVAMRGTALYAAAAAGGPALSFTLVGSDNRTIPAGTHSIDVGGQCLQPTSTFSNVSVLSLSISTVTVTPA
jgi:hypothetical protein